MSRDPFLRLGLIALATVYVLGLVAAARFLGWPAAVVAGIVGVAAAAALTIEFVPTTPAVDRFARRRQPRDGTAGFERTQA